MLDLVSRLPRDTSIDGLPGDRWSVATTDGTHNFDFENACLTVMTPCTSTNPPACVEHDGAALKRLSGPLFARDPSFGDVRQGAIRDCWLVSAVDALANVAPQRLRELFTENDDGTVTVSFHRFDHKTGRVVREPITVTNSAYARDGALLYGKGDGDTRWFPLLGKAYAAWKGGFEAIVSGYPFEAFEALLGKPGMHLDLDISSPDAVWSALKKPDQVLATWTRVDSKELRFSNTGLQADHAYAVIGVNERGSERTVTLRNPWGENGWAAKNGTLGLEVASNGLLSMKLDVFVRYFVGLGSVDPF